MAREMKNSGVKWIGEIPINWKIDRMKYLVNNYKSGPFGSSLITGDLLPEGTILVYTPEHIASGELEADTNLYLPDNRRTEMSQFFVKSGEIVFPIVGSLGRAMLVKDDMPEGIINQRLAKFSIDRNRIDERYFMWIYGRSQFYAKYIELYCRGSIIVNLTKNLIGNMPVPLPPLSEQQAIADFLDAKCAEIDGLLTDLDAEIRTLTEYKKSIIAETVTRGLNPNAPMKQSGIPWAEEIPSHWHLHPVYNYFSQRVHKNIFGKEQNLLSLSFGKIILKDINAVGGLLPASYNSYNIVEAGDIIIRPTDLQNDKRSLRTGLVTEHGIITSAYIALKPNNNIHSPYFHYLLHSYDIKKVFYNMGNGVRQGLNYSEFSQLMLFEPPIEEQEAIASYLDKKCSIIDQSIADKQTQIEALKSYKSSLIYEYVTGKKQVI